MKRIANTLAVLGCLALAPAAQAVTFEALFNPNVPESGGSVDITIRLSATAAETSNGSCTIDGGYFAADSETSTVALAIEGEDYEGVGSGLSLSLAANSAADVTISEVVTIPIISDTRVEPIQESFSFVVELETFDCFGAVVSDLDVDLVIVDDDPLQFALSPNTSIDEDADFASISIEALNLGDAPGGITADLVVSTVNGSANAGEDYEATSQTFTFNQNLGISSFEVPIIDDAEVESDEAFSISVTSASAVDGAFAVLVDVDPGETSVTIVDNDVAPLITLAFQDAEVRFLENQAFALLQVVPAQAPTAPITVDFATADGGARSPDDFTATTNTLTFPAGSTAPQAIQIPLINDATDEGQEVFSVVLSNPVGARVDADTATVIIEDNDTSVSSDVALTGAPGETVTLTYSTPDQGDRETQEGFSTVTITGTGPFTVEYTAVIPANAVDGQTFDDAVVLPIDVPPPVELFVTLITSTAVAPTEYEFVTVSTSAGEAAGSVELQVRRTGDVSNSGQVEYRTVESGSATSGEDFEAITDAVVFGPGEAGPVSASIGLLDDLDDEVDEDFTVELFNPLDGTVSTVSGVASVVILDDDDSDVASPGTLQFAVSELSINEADGTVELEVSRTGGTDGVATVEFLTIQDTAIEGEDFTATTGSLSWPTGDGDPRTISVPLLADTEVEGAEEFTVVLQNPTVAALGTPAVIGITITDLGRDIAGIPGLSANQKQMAGWFDANCERLISSDPSGADQQDLANVCQNLRSANTTDDQVRNGLDAVNAEELATAATTTLRLLGDQHGNLQRRINGLRSGARGIDMAGLSITVDGQNVSGAALEEMLHGLTWGAVDGESDFGRWGFFIDGKIDFGDRDDNVANNGYDFDSTLVTVGADYRIKDNFFVGGAFGYANADVDFNGGGGLDFDSYRGSVFTTYFPSESYYVDALVSYGTTDYDSARRILYTDSGGTVDRTATGSTDGSVLSAGVGSGFDFARGALTFGPNFGAYYFHVDVDGYSEGGAGGLNLNIGDQSAKSFTANVGGHASWVINTKWGVLIPNARFDMVREFQDGVEEVGIRFAADPFSNDPSNPSAPIVVQSERPDENYVVWSVGASAQFVRGFSGFVTYQGTEGYNDLKLTEVSFGMRYEKTF